MSKLEQYTQTEKSDHEVAKHILVQQLAHRKYEDRTSAKDLAAMTPVSVSTVRSLIRQIRKEYRLPIYSFNDGYFRVRKLEHFEKAIERLDKKIETKVETKQQLTAAYNEQGVCKCGVRNDG